MPCVIMLLWNPVLNHITETHATKEVFLKMGAEVPEEDQQH